MSEHPIKRFRAEASLSPTEFGKRVGCKRWMVHMIETGKRRPSFDLLQRICAFTGISSDEILRATPPLSGAPQENQSLQLIS